MAIDHLDLVVTDFERSLAFHRGLLGPLGYTVCFHDPDGIKLEIVHRP